jgi:hypothetical protein
MVHKTPKELASLSPAKLKQYHADEENAVFGVGHKHTRHGDPIEQGLGSLAQPTLQSIKAYEKYGRGEPDFDKQLADMKARLAEYNEHRSKGRKRAAA